MINKINPNALLPRSLEQNQPTEPTGKNFKNTLSEFLNDVDDMQEQDKATTEAFLRGDITDLHQVTMAAEKARLSLELLLEIRNKLVESYQEIMRMQV